MTMPICPAIMIFDHQYRQRYPVASLMPGEPLPGWISSADTLADLAAEIGVDGDQLADSVAAFNQHAVNANDPQFGRGRSEI